jgi:hypothetical protein
MKIFDDHNRMRISILLLLSLTMCTVVSAEIKYSTGAKESKIMSLLENRRSNLSGYSEAGISTRGDHRLPTEALFRQDEFLIDTNIVYVSAAVEQINPNITFNGTNYLVVWHDKRNGSGVNDIYGARVSQNGVVLDSAGIAISIETSDAAVPSVAFDGTNYLVSWQDNRNGHSDIYGARVGQDGTVLDPLGIAISMADSNQLCSSIAFDGTNYLVVWHDKRNGSGFTRCDIYGARVSQDGTILDPAGIAIDTTTSYKVYPSVAFDGTNYLVSWQDDRNGTADIYGTRVTQDGVVLDSSGIAISTAEYEQGSPAITWDGTNFLVSWTDMRNGLDCDIYGARVNQDGVVLDPSGIAFSTASNHQYDPSVAFDGTDYFVFWTDERNPSSSYDIYGARVSQDGVVLDPAGIAISIADNYQWEPTVAFDGTNYLVAWADKRNLASGNYQHDIYGARVSQDGAVLDSSGTILSMAAYYQLSPSVAFDGTNYLCVWADGRRMDSHDDIHSARVSQDGVILDPAGIAISTAAYDQNAPSVGFDGTNYLIVWHDQRSGYYDIYGARVDQQGMVLDPDGIAISQASSHQAYPAVAFDGTNYMTVWTDSRYVFQYVYGARVSQDGTILDPAGIAIDTSVICYGKPSVAFDGTNYMVVWHVYAGSIYQYEIYGTRVSQDGVVLDPSFIRISLNNPAAQLDPSVAFDGTNYLIVWRDNRISGSGWEIYGARVSQDGMILDSSGIAIDTTTSFKRDPSVAFDDVDYQVVWGDKRNGEFDIYGAKVSTAGSVIDTFAVSLQSGNQFTPALAHGADDQILITYSGWTDSINTHPAHTMHIWGKLYPNVGIEEAAPHTTPYVIHLNVYPTIFSKSLCIEYNLGQSVKRSVIKGQESSSYKGDVALKIYDVMGRLVKLFNYPTDQAFNQIIWSGAGGSGRPLPTGIYFVRLEVGDYEQTEKVLLLR